MKAKARVTMRFVENWTPDNLDWVKARNECSAAQMFEGLKREIGSDIAIRNSQLPPGSPFTFTLEIFNGSFSVIRKAAGDSPSVIFSRKGEEITAKNSNSGELIFVATVTLNDLGECKFKLKESGKAEYSEKYSWQVRRLALQELLFD